MAGGVSFRRVLGSTGIRLSVRLVTHTAPVNSQYPPRTLAGQPIRSRLNNAARQKVIALASLICILIEGRNQDASFEADLGPALIGGTVAMR